jgi:prophage regulatory protein
MSTSNNLADIVYYSDRDLAKRYHVHYMTIWKWARYGKLPKPIKIADNTTRWRSDQIFAHEAKLQKTA